MNPETANHLLRINQTFYATFAETFSETRVNLNPGIRRVLAMPPWCCAEELLDIGCGDGRVGNAWLTQRDSTLSRYIGIDGSAALLEQARHRLQHHQSNSWQLIHAELVDASWRARLGEHTFSATVCFAVLHHLPPLYQLPFLQQIRNMMPVGGNAALSIWQFIDLARTRRKIVPWESVGIHPESVTENDYLLDWRQNGYGIRYVHAFTLPSLSILCEAAGFEVMDSFVSDGAAGNGGLYVMLRAG